MTHNSWRNGPKGWRPFRASMDRFIKPMGIPSEEGFRKGKIKTAITQRNKKVKITLPKTPWDKQ